MKAQPSPALVLAMCCLLAGTLLLVFATLWPRPTVTPIPAPPTPTLVAAPTLAPLPLLEAGPARAHWTPTPRGR